MVFNLSWILLKDPSQMLQGWGVYAVCFQALHVHSCSSSLYWPLSFLDALGKEFVWREYATIEKKKKSHGDDSWVILRLESDCLAWLHVPFHDFPSYYPGLKGSAGAMCNFQVPSCFRGAAPLEVCPCAFMRLFISCCFFLRVNLLGFLLPLCSALHSFRSWLCDALPRASFLLKPFFVCYHAVVSPSF